MYKKVFLKKNETIFDRYKKMIRSEFKNILNRDVNTVSDLYRFCKDLIEAASNYHPAGKIAPSSDNLEMLRFGLDSFNHIFKEDEETQVWVFDSFSNKYVEYWLTKKDLVEMYSDTMSYFLNLRLVYNKIFDKLYFASKSKKSEMNNVIKSIDVEKEFVNIIKEMEGIK